MRSTPKRPKQGDGVRVLVVDDHPVVRAGLVQLIDDEADLRVCGQASGINEALTVMRTTLPDLVVVDLSLSDGSGLELIKQIKAERPATKILVLSMHDETLYAPRALRAGAVGYISKAEAPHMILQAVRAVVSGEVYLSPQIGQRFLRGMVAGGAGMAKSVFETLTDRELEVFELLGQGLGTRQISEKLFVSVKTVESHCDHLKTKLGLSSTRELARHAILWVQEQK